MPQLTDYESKSLENFEKAIIAGKFSTECLVQFFELAGQYLNVCSPAQYARINNLSYNGVKNNRKIRTLNKIKYLVIES